MNVGIFDHVDRNGAALREFYEHRLRVCELYDPPGFHRSPDTVMAAARKQFAASGFTDLRGQFAFGDLDFEDTVRSNALFAREVMPAMRKLEPAAPRA